MLFIVLYPKGWGDTEDTQLRAEDVLNQQKVVLLYSHRVFLHAESCEKGAVNRCRKDAIAAINLIA